MLRQKNNSPSVACADFSNFGRGEYNVQQEQNLYTKNDCIVKVQTNEQSHPYNKNLQTVLLLQLCLQTYIC